MTHGIVYKATCSVNGKCYVGQVLDRHRLRTSEYLLERRRKRHLRVAGQGSDFAFHRALRKYDPSMFVWTVIAVADDPVVLSRLEAEAIQSARSLVTDHGYNILASSPPSVIPPSVREKMLASAKARWADPERRLALDSSIRAGKARNADKIREVGERMATEVLRRPDVRRRAKETQSSDEFKRTISKSSKARNARPFVVLDANTREVVFNGMNLVDAAKEFGVLPESIGKCINGRSKTFCRGKFTARWV